VNTVAAVMAEHGWAGRKAPRRRSLTRQGRRPVAPDLVNRRFWANRPDQLWCGDVTYIDTGEGRLYLATVLDLCSRRLLGYAMSDHHDAALTEAALAMAVTTRAGECRDTRGVVFHTDRGSEGGFNWSSQHLEFGGVRWEEPGVGRWCRRVRGGSGRRIGRCGRRCVHRVGLSRLVRCSGSSGGGSRRG
jgi:putative transposase